MTLQKSRWFIALFVLCCIASIIVFTSNTIHVTEAQSNQQYTVQPGDTLSGIASKLGVNMWDLIDLNNISDPNLIHSGVVLKLPGGYTAPQPPTPRPWTPPSNAPPPPQKPSATTSYSVKPGDTLSSIARQFGINMYTLAEANDLDNINFLYVGQQLTIPGVHNTAPKGPWPTATPQGPWPTATPRQWSPAAQQGPWPTATPRPWSPPAAPRIPAGNFELGGQTHTLDNPGRMRDASMNWVKFQHKWSPGDNPNVLAGRIEQAHSQGFKVLLSIPGANTYPGPGGIDFGRYVTFLRGVATLGPDAIEVWNEMNIDFEWPAGEINPASYVNDMLKPAYQAIKAANPNVMVISGAPAPTGFDNNHNAWADDRYMRGMAAAGGAAYMDCIGVHHNAGATSPYATSGHPAGAHYSWYYGATMNVYHSAFGGARPLCITELGYLTGDGYPSLPPNFLWAGNTTLGQHAQWLGEAVTISRTSGRVRLLIIFNVDFTHYDTSGDPQAGYGMIRPNGQCPSCDTMRAAMGG